MSTSHSSWDGGDDDGDKKGSSAAEPITPSEIDHEIEKQTGEMHGSEAPFTRDTDD